MKIQSYKQRWAEQKENPELSQLGHLGKQIALSFLDHHFYNERYRDDYIELLCEMATTFTDAALNKAVSSALFGIIVESLCDDFEEANTQVYNRVMSQTVSYYRQTPAGAEMDKQLQAFGLYSAEDIYNRIECLRATSEAPKDAENFAPEKIIVLSRVTLGADVAITSIVVQHLQHIFPQSELVLLGGEKLYDLFGGNERVTIKQIDYSRRGSLAERLNAWHSVRLAVAAETAHIPPERVMVIDPDSRLSQLGIFPLVQDSPYLFFDSRGNDEHPRRITMAGLTNCWLNKVLTSSAFYYPRVWLQKHDLAKGRDMLQRLRTNGCRRIITVNFGVGGNERKRLSSQAEEKLVQQLLCTPDTVVVLDKGAGEAEKRRIESLAERIARSSCAVLYRDTVNAHLEPEFRHGLLCVSAEIGEMAALIAYSDEYIGYDSACQHIAAAQHIPTCTIFAGSNDPAFVRRWCATGPGETHLVHVDTLTTPAMFADDDVVARVIHARYEEYQP